MDGLVPPVQAGGHLHLKPQNRELQNFVDEIV